MQNIWISNKIRRKSSTDFKNFCNCQIDFSDKTDDNIHICILGDQYQSIYDFNNADSRFIVFGDKLYKGSNADAKRTSDLNIGDLNIS